MYYKYNDVICTSEFIIVFQLITVLSFKYKENIMIYFGLIISECNIRFLVFVFLFVLFGKHVFECFFSGEIGKRTVSSEVRSR